MARRKVMLSSPLAEQRAEWELIIKATAQLATEHDMRPIDVLAGDLGPDAVEARMERLERFGDGPRLAWSKP